MPDNTLLNPGSGGDLSRTIDRSGSGPKTQVVNLDIGLAGAGNETIMRGAATIPDNQAMGIPVRAIGQDLWACSFTSVIAAGIDTTFFDELALGTGVARSQSAGSLLITTGTTTNAEYLARSKLSWRSSMLMRYRFTASQRIANQNFALMLADKIIDNAACTINSATSITVTVPAHGFTAVNVGQSMMIGGIIGAAGVPGRYAIASVIDANTLTFTVAGWPASGSCTIDLFGWSYIRNLYNGVTATNSAFDSQRRGWATAAATATINTTAAPGHIGQVLLDGRNAYLDDMLSASSTAPNVATRASAHENLPDDNLDLFIYLWSYNGTTAPASTTTWTIGFVSLERFANQPVFVAGQKMQGAHAPAPVTVQGTAAVSMVTNTPTLAGGTNLACDVGSQLRANATGAASIRHIVSAASTNATNAKASAGRVAGWSFVNTTASYQYVKLHNTAAAPTAGAGVVLTIAIPPNGVNNMPVSEVGIGFATGIAFTIVTGSADADATATTAGAVVGDLFFA